MRPSGAMKLRGYVAEKLLVFTFVSRRIAAVRIADFRQIARRIAALDVDLAVQQRGRAGVPSRAVEIVAAGQRVARGREDIAVVVTGVGGRAVDPVVARR